MIKYKIDIIQALKDNGYTTYKIRQENLFNESTLTKFRHGNTNITLTTIDNLCQLLKCDINDIIELSND